MKDERILIYAVTDECYYKNGKYCGCGVKMGVLEDSDCASCKDRHLVGIPYSETIEKMAKAMYEHQYQKTRPFWEDDDNGYREIYLKRAEAALKALLEDK